MLSTSQLLYVADTDARSLSGHAELSKSTVSVDWCKLPLAACRFYLRTFDIQQVDNRNLRTFTYVQLAEDGFHIHKRAM